MEERRIRVYKDEPHIQVYQDLDNVNSIFKKYRVDYNIYNSKEDLKQIRQRLIDVKNCRNWPSFAIKPKNISRLNAKSFMVELPFIDRARLDDYLFDNDINLLSLAKFISNLEKEIMHEEQFVFPDIANTGNILVSTDKNNITDFTIIDPDGIQFDNYNCEQIAVLLGAGLFGGEKANGLEKCFDTEGIANKQLDIRSMYALLFIIINNEDCLYPIFAEKSMDEYLGLLKTSNIPFGSNLYKKTIKSLSNDEQNELIGDSLFELADSGYELEVYDRDSRGNKYVLTKK